MMNKMEPIACMIVKEEKPRLTNMIVQNIIAVDKAIPVSVRYNFSSFFSVVEAVCI